MRADQELQYIQADGHLTGLFHPVAAIAGGAERYPVGVGLVPIPAGAETESKATVGDDVDRGRHVGQHCGVAVVGCRRRAHPAAAVASPGQGRQGGRAPARLEGIDLVGLAPDGEHVGPGGVLRRGLEGVAQ
jgi:hypothetical protein